jgi:hypothetical protein
MRYRQIDDGKPFRPLPGYRHMCCDCRGVWTFSFRVLADGKAEVECTRDARASAAARRRFGFTPARDHEDEIVVFRIGRNGHRHICPDCCLTHKMTRTVRGDGQIEIRLVRV